MKFPNEAKRKSSGEFPRPRLPSPRHRSTYSPIDAMLQSYVLIHLITGLSPLIYSAARLSDFVVPVLYWFAVRPSIRTSTLSLPLLLFSGFALYAWSSLLWSHSPQLSRAAEVTTALAGAMSIAHHIGTTGSLRVVTVPAYAALVASAVISTGRSSDAARNSGTLEHPTDLSILATVVAVIASLKLLEALRGDRNRFIPILTSAGMLALCLHSALNIAGSRGAIVALAISVTWILAESLWLARKNFRAFAVILISPVILIFAYRFASTSTYFYRVASAMHFAEFGVAVREKSLYIREDMLMAALRLWEASPVFGHGVDSFRLLAPYGTYSHNNYAEILATLGLIGLLLFYGPFVLGTLSLASTYQRNRATPDGLRARWAVVVLVVILTLSTHAVIYYHFGAWLLSAMFFGYIAQSSATTERKRPQHRRIA